LKVGDLIDAYDKAKQWYGSTIIGEKQIEIGGRSYKNFEIGFRIYSETGAKQDTDGSKFDGWSCKFDEWITQLSPKIAKLHTNTKPYGGKKVVKSYEDMLIDDGSDPSFEEKGSYLFCSTTKKQQVNFAYPSS
jgi:hypothetical protein